jgi:hypothetical protein
MFSYLHANVTLKYRAAFKQSVVFQLKEIISRCPLGKNMKSGREKGGKCIRKRKKGESCHCYESLIGIGGRPNCYSVN